MIIDYSTWRPSIKTLQGAGVTAVGRYIGWDCQPGFQCIHKNLTKSEAAALLAAGIDIFVSFEYEPDAALNGEQQGARDAKLAGDQLAALGAPHGMTVYWAVDFDIKDYAPASSDPERKLGPAAGYFHAINNAKLPYQTGVYGGYYAVSRVMDAGLASMGWQTVAWSGGQWYAKAVLRQLAQQFMGFSDVNLHLAAGDDFGQYPRPAVLPGRTWGEWDTKGHTSLQQVAAAVGMSPAHILRATAVHYGKFDAVTADYVNKVLTGELDPAADIPAGGKLWVLR